jgi:hypothetical protein
MTALSQETLPLTLRHSGARIFVPDRLETKAALRRITHLGLGAHQDDLEFMAFHGILNCYRKPDHWFGGVTCTNGAGSARTGRYASYTDEQMQSVRVEEQDAAAVVGGYGIMTSTTRTSAWSLPPCKLCVNSRPPSVHAPSMAARSGEIWTG